MSPDLFIKLHKALLPHGSAWNIKEDGDWDSVISGSAENWTKVYGDLLQLAYLRDPENTPIFEDLEIEYGIRPTDTISDTRVLQLKTLVNAIKNDGTAATLEAALRGAGFDIYVHENTPPAEPSQFVDLFAKMVADGDNAYAGFIPAGGTEITSIAGFVRGLIVIDGKEEPVFLPTDPDVWGYIFFFGGEATRDPVTDEITAIDTANVPIEDKTFLETLILRYKPLHTWGFGVINFI